MADRFFTDAPLAPGDFTLEGPEAHHLATVRRFQPGDLVTLFNGDGHEYPAEVLSVGKKRVELHVRSVETPQRELPFRLEVASALPKGDRGDFLIEKLTELGVTRFVPLQTARSVVQPREARLEKLQRAVIEASKQCGRNVLMEVAPLTPWADYCAAVDAETRLIAHPAEARQGDRETGRQGEEEEIPAPCLPVSLSPCLASKAVAVGPEGGFTPEEVEQAHRAGWRVVGLGPRVLRVETAALVLAAWFAQAGSAE